MGSTVASMGTTSSRRPIGTLIFLVLSALLGIAILATDNNLWSTSPNNAYGLIVFVIIDLAVAALVMMKPSRMNLRVAGVWGLLFVLIMIADIFMGPASYGTYMDFAQYLFGVAYYDSNHIAFLFPALFVVNILVALLGFMDSRKAS